MKKEWQAKPLGEVCQIVNGGTPKTGIPEYWSGEYRWITPAEMGRRLCPYVSDTERRITAAGLANCSARMLPPNSVILSSRAPIGHLVINTEPMATNQGCKGLIPAGSVDSKYLYHYLSSIVDLLNSLGTGTTFKELSGGKLKEIPIPLPPLSEQRRIVGILDEAFAAIAAARANTEKNLQNARALFESHLNTVFSQKGDGWVEKRLGEVALINYGYTESASWEAVGPKFLRITDIQDDRVDWSKAPYCHIGEKDLPKYALHDGDIVFARTGATTGKSYLVTQPPHSVFASYLIRLRLKAKGVLPQFVNLFFKTESYWDNIRLGVSGSAQGGFNATKLSEVSVSFPMEQAKQCEIISMSEELSAETRRLEGLYTRKLEALTALKQSLLHAAFSGEL